MPPRGFTIHGHVHNLKARAFIYSSALQFQNLIRARTLPFASIHLFDSFFCIAYLICFQTSHSFFFMPPPTPSSGPAPNSQNQDLPAPPSSSSVASTLESSYFLPLPSSTPSHSNTPHSTSGPVITTNFMSSNSNPTSPNQPSASSPHYLPSDIVEQFALHMPTPPTLLLSQSAVRNPPPNATNLAPHVSVSSKPSPLPNTNMDTLPSPMDRTRRMPPSSQTPDMTLSSSTTTHTLSVMLPRSIQPEMVTISANKGDRLRVVADAWHMEGESELATYFFFSAFPLYFYLTAGMLPFSASFLFIFAYPT